MRLPIAAPDGLIDASSLYTLAGERKYINAEERRRLLVAAAALAPKERLLLLTLFHTGVRISEALAITRTSLQRVEGGGVLTVVTLKRRKHAVREIPIPPGLADDLERTFGLSDTDPGARTLPGSHAGTDRLWPLSRSTGYRLVVAAMHAAGIVGKRASPRGMRHGFGIAALHAGVPLTLLQKWMGHASLRTTAIYLAVCGPDEIAFAARLWHEPPAQARLAVSGRPDARPPSQ